MVIVPSPTTTVIRSMWYGDAKAGPVVRETSNGLAGQGNTPGLKETIPSTEYMKILPV